MALIFGTDAGVRESPTTSFTNQLAQDFFTIKNGIQANLSHLDGEVTNLPPPPPKENVYVDNGWSNVPGTAFPGSQIENIDDFKTRRITTQEPTATIYVQKKAFRALRGEFDTRFMDTGEKLLLRATKILFENKCNQIATYESLTKVKQVLNEEAELDAARIRMIVDIFRNSESTFIDTLNNAVLTEFEATGDPSIFARSDEAFTGLNSVINQLDSLTDVTLESIARRAESTKLEDTTTWVVDPDAVDDLVKIGRGSGTIELTLVSNVSTHLSLNVGDVGTFSFSIQDPYNLTKITSDEVEIALVAAYRESNVLGGKGGNVTDDFLLGPQALLHLAQKKERELSALRRNRINGQFSNFGVSRSPGSVLSGGDAAEIVFTVNPNTLSAQKITISSTASTEVFDSLPTFKLSMLQLSNAQQLTTDEEQLVDEIFDLLGRYAVEIARLTDDLANTNNDPNVIYARKKMRQYYVGKNIVQPMDTVHIFMRGRTFRDGQQLGPLNALLYGQPFVQSFATDQNASDAVLEEEMRQFGLDELDIPLSLYRSMRTGSFLRNAGMHVFGGLISTVTQNYSNGSYNVNVSGESNMKWLTVSQTNISPSLDQRHGVLEDPLTPFDFSSPDAIDPGTGLIRPDPPLLQDNINNPALIYNSGILKGKKLDGQNIKQDQVVIGNTGIPVIKHAPGLVYRWKEGVIAVTINNNLTTALGSSALNTPKLKRDIGINLTTSPFVSMDAADIISVLVTGFPHNYDSFVMNTQDTGTFVSGGDTNSSFDFFHSFFDVTRSTNRALGNFQPYKMINVTPEEAAQRIQLQTDLKSNSAEIQRLRSDVAKIADQYNNAVSIKGFSSADSEDVALSDKVASLLNTQLQETQKALDEKVAQFYSAAQNRAGNNSGMSLYGNDIAFELERNIDEDEDQRDSIRRTRLRNNLRVFRNQYDVKFNKDNNLFIVSDEYDKDLDIQAFALQMAQKGGPDLFKSSYNSPFEICKKVAEKLDFEFFCDANGHIQFRPPMYNKTPLSLLLKLFLLDTNQNKKLYPPFLESLFQSKAQKIQYDLEVVQIEIDIKNILLGNRNVTIPVFSATKNDGNSQSNIVQDENTTDPIAATFLLKGVGASQSTIQNLAEALIDARNRLAAKTGQRSTPKNDETLKAAADELDKLNNPSYPNTNSSRLSITTKLAELKSKLEGLITLKKRFDDQGAMFQTKITPDSTTLGNKSTDRIDTNALLKPFASLIEDDFLDSLGPDSSKRYIITDEQIIDYDFTESDKNVFMRVEVTGEQDLIGGPQGEVAGIPQIVADATDFDLWRQYGYRTLRSVSRPYFKDAETQCAPYALMLLNRARRDVVTGSITVAGNEYYQLGDVVYINSRDLLFYVYGVRHQMAYDSGRFTTTLDLKYGHPLGEYIATPLDVIGKNLIKNQTQFNRTLSSRTTSGGQLGVHLGLVVFPPDSTTTQDSSEHPGDPLFPVRREMLSGGRGAFNAAQLKDTLVKARKQISNSDAKNAPPFPKIEVRGYVSDISQVAVVSDRMRTVAQWLTQPTGRFFDDSDKPISLGTFYTEKNKISPAEIYNMDFNSDGPSLSNGNDPINIINPAQENIDLSRLPKEEVFNVAKSKSDVSNVVEIVLLLEQPRARGTIL